MDIVAPVVGAFGIGGMLAGLGALGWGLLLVVLRPDRRSQGDGVIFIGGGAAAVVAGLGALAWVSI